MPARISGPVVLGVSSALAGAIVAVVFGDLVHLGRAPSATTAPPHDAVAFDPPPPEQAPAESVAAVLHGREILEDTRHQIQVYDRVHRVQVPVGNDLACSNCHFEAGIDRTALPLVGVAAIYPRYRARTGYSTDLPSRVNECFERSMNGRQLDPRGRDMQAIIAYLHWISRGLPVYAEVPWLGLVPVRSTHAPDAAAGAKTWAAKCALCHGERGEGSPAAPPVWGPRSYNDGAGMHRPETFAAFTLATMPRSAPDLLPEQALDVAAFVHGRPRPHFAPPRRR